MGEGLLRSVGGHHSGQWLPAGADWDGPGSSAAGPCCDQRRPESGPACAQLHRVCRAA